MPASLARINQKTLQLRAETFPLSVDGGFDGKLGETKS